MANYGILETAEEDALHSSRPLNVEDRAFKPISKKLLARTSPITFASPAKATDSSEDAGHDPSTIDEAASEQQETQRKQWKDDLTLVFTVFESHVKRAQLVLNSNKQERSRYANEKTEIRDTAQAVKENNAALREQLREAQDTREIRKGYDKLAEKITNNKTLKPRSEQQAKIDKLHAEIAELEAESQEYATTWAERREQFGKIVDEGEQLLRLIRDEKEEAEREEGLEDTGDEKVSSRGGTPAGSSTPAHNPGTSDAPSPGQGSKLKDSAMAVDTEEQPAQAEKMEEDDTKGKMSASTENHAMQGIERASTPAAAASAAEEGDSQDKALAEKMDET